MAVSQLTLLTNINLMATTYLPGVEMGEIDAMSRREIHPDIAAVCPSLVPSLLIDLEIPVIHRLFQLCDPAAVHSGERDFHQTSLSILHILRDVLHSFDTPL